MPPQLLFPIDDIDFEAVQYGADYIEEVNPHRGAMRMLDGICWTDEGLSKAIAFKDIRDDEFWVPGHIPGRPLFPGVLMMEAGAQLASFMTLKRAPELNFIGFIGLDDVKFRGQVTPGDRLYLMGEEVEFRKRRIVCNVQGMVNGTVVCEGRITGMPI